MSQDDLGRYVPPRESVPSAHLPDEPRTGSGSSEPFPTRGYSACFARITVTLGAPSGQSDVRLETRLVNGDATSEWYEVGRFAADGDDDASSARGFAPLGDESRWAWSLVGGELGFYIESLFGG